MSNKPNILIVLADQHRYDCIGAYGNREIQTPNIDGIAEDGVLYTNSFCPYPVCTPSRYSFISGLYVHQHLGWTNHATLPEGIETFPKMLKKEGYQTKAVGKMHFTPTYLDVGFEDMILAEQNGNGRFDDDYHKHLMTIGLFDEIDLIDQVDEYRKQATQEYFQALGAIESNLSEKHHSTTWIAEQALKSLDNWDDEGNCLMVGFVKPHHPFDPPKPWSNMYNPDELSLLPGWMEEHLPQDLQKIKGFFPYESLTEANVKQAMAYYYASISQIDHQVGKMVQLLKMKGLYDNTMIIYTSDHGDYMGYHRLILKENYMYEPLIKVPLIIKYPYQNMMGEVVDSLISNVDIAPTILKQAEITPTKTMTGIDLASKTDKRDFVFAENAMASEYMVRSKNYKLLLCKDEKKSQFFDLQNDKTEYNNLYKSPQYQELINEYKHKLYDWILFDAPSVPYVNEGAPMIHNGHTSYDLQENHASESKYFRMKMKESIYLKPNITPSSNI